MSQAPLREIFQWDVRTWSRALPLWEKYIPSTQGGEALAIGERDGGLSLWLAQHGIRVLCTDLHGPTDQAKALHSGSGLGQLISYGAQDATRLELADARFDLVIFKSVIGALGTKERQQQAIDEMRRVLKPGGVLLFAENLSGTYLHRSLRKRFIAWDHYWRYLRMPGDLDLFQGFERMETRTTGFLANLGRNEGQRDALARFDGWIMPLIPSSWRYILYGAMRKT